MQDARARYCLSAPEFTFSATVELPKSPEIRDMSRLVGLFMWLLRDLGEVIRRHSQTDAAESQIETLNYSLQLIRLREKLSIRLRPSERSDATEEIAHQMMLDLLRAAFPVIRPVRIVWQGQDEALSVDEFLKSSGRIAPKRPHLRVVNQRRARPAKEYRFEYLGYLPMRYVAPRKVGGDWAAANRITPKTPRPPRAPVALPAIPMREEPDNKHTRLTELRGSGDVSADAFNMFERESAPRRLLSWALTGVTAAFFLPAAAGMAVLNLTKGENLRLNALAMALTVSCVVLHDSGYPTKAAAWLDPVLRDGGLQAWNALTALLA